MVQRVIYCRTAVCVGSSCTATGDSKCKYSHLFRDLSVINVKASYLDTYLRTTYLRAAASGRSNDERCGSCAGNPRFFPLTLVSRSRGASSSSRSPHRRPHAYPVQHGHSGATILFQSQQSCVQAPQLLFYGAVVTRRRP